MNVLTDLWNTTKDLATNAAGTALDGYAQKLAGGTPAGQGQAAAPATIGEPKTSPWLIGGAIAAVVALILVLTRK